MLIVDDEAGIVAALSDYFEAKGLAVDSADELEEAERLLDERYYDIIIADLRLTGIKGVEGLELISYVRERHLATRVILLTAYGTTEIQREAEERGVDAFLSKPQPLADIARVVTSLLVPSGNDPRVS